MSGEGSKGFLGMVLKPDLVKAIVNIVEGDNALADDRERGLLCSEFYMEV